MSVCDDCDERDREGRMARCGDECGSRRRERKRAYNRRWRAKHRDTFRANIARFRGRHRAEGRAYAKAYAAAHPKRVAARSRVRWAIAGGRLERKPCERCGEPNTIGHHEDYDQPLTVTWLCRSCHGLFHCGARRAAKQEVIADGS